MDRDDKALVHCDVEVVQRPGKFWAKVTYSDHDWDKDTQITLPLSILQFVKLKDVLYDEDAIAQLGVQVCHSKLYGGAASLVKIQFFESSTIFCHFNKLLFVMSHPQHQQIFMHGNDLLT